MAWSIEWQMGKPMPNGNPASAGVARVTNAVTQAGGLGAFTVNWVFMKPMLVEPGSVQVTDQ